MCDYVAAHHAFDKENTKMSSTSSFILHLDSLSDALEFRKITPRVMKRSE